MGVVFGVRWYVTMVGRVEKLERQKQELITMEFLMKMMVVWEGGENLAGEAGGRLISVIRLD